MAARKRYTLSQIRSQLSDKLQRSPFWATPELNAIINEWLRTWSCLTGYWKQRITLNTLPTLPYYGLNGFLTFGTRVEFNGTPLLQATVHEWDKGYPYWEGRPSSTGPTEWAPIALNLIAIRPADAIGNNSLVLDGLAFAPILVSDSDFIDIGDEEFDLGLGYCQYLAAFKEGGQEFESSIALYQAFIKGAAVKNEKLNASSIFRRAMGLDAEQAGQRPRRAKSTMQPVGER